MRRLAPLTLLLAAVLAAPLAAQRPARAHWQGELGDSVVSPERLRAITDRLLEPLQWPPPPLSDPPSGVRAIYLNAWVFGSHRFYDLVRLADTTEINAFIIDVKDGTGYVTYSSSVPTAIAIGANHQLRARDVRERLEVMHRHGIYPIARIVVAKDPLLAAGKPAWSVQDKRGGLWHDRLGFAWVDAFNDSVWVYAAQLGAEAIRMGFSELQFDYVRFPDEPRSRMATAIFSSRRPGESTRDGVRRNLRLLRDRVKTLGVPFTIDVFGMTASAQDDMGIGQVWEDLISTADVVLPMVYPSHYYGGFYNISHPNTEPYSVVHRAIQDGLRRSVGIAKPAKIRPFLQAFTLGRPRYTPWHVREQIRAVEDLGIDSWALWNARGVYNPAIFRPAVEKKSVAKEEAGTGNQPPAAGQETANLP
jgi:hypothetical protein